MDYLCYLDICYLIMNILSTIKSKMQSNQCQLFEPHEPLIILVEYDMCLLLQFPNTPGCANEDDWNEDYRYGY